MRVRIPRPVCRALAAFVLSTALACSFARAAGNTVPVHVTVAGEQMSYDDVIQLTVFAIGASGIMSNAVIDYPAQMPKATPYIYYAGKDPAGKPIFEASRIVTQHVKLSRPVQAEIEREGTAAGLLAILDMGKGPAKWRSLFEKVRGNPARMAAFGLQLMDAISAMSKETVAYSAATRRWMFDTLAAGTPRARVYDILRARNLAATGGPKGQTNFPAQGTATVSLPGAFEPGCYFSTNVTITFDANDRLYKMDLSQPIPDCL